MYRSIITYILLIVCTSTFSHRQRQKSNETESKTETFKVNMTLLPMRGIYFTYLFRKNSCICTSLQVKVFPKNVLRYSRKVNLCISIPALDVLVTAPDVMVNHV